MTEILEVSEVPCDFFLVFLLFVTSPEYIQFPLEPSISAFFLGSETGQCSVTISLYVVIVDVSTQLPKKINYTYLQNNKARVSQCSVLFLTDMSLQRNAPRRVLR